MQQVAQLAAKELGLAASELAGLSLIRQIELLHAKAFSAATARGAAQPSSGAPPVVHGVVVGIPDAA